MKRAPLALAALLQLVPLCRTGALAQAAAAPSIAIVFTWIAGAAVLLGGYDAVSGASASISGLVKYVDTTPVGTPTNYVVEPVGEPFKYRITVTNPGVDVDKNYFNCDPLPDGLTINTNAGAAGYITGIPTTVGTYLVTLTAGNLDYPIPATAPATIVIYPTNTAPSIIGQPESLSVRAGSNAVFSVVAEGSLPLSYLWLKDEVPLSNASSALLTLTNVTVDLSGNYQAVVTNDFGSITSLVARLTVREDSIFQVTLSAATLSSNAFSFTVSGPSNTNAFNTNYVIWTSTDLTAWTELARTNHPDGYFMFIDTDAGSYPIRFYRVSFFP